MEKCIGCELCAGVCPADCIYVRGSGQPARPPGLARGAVRLRLRDQLPAVHPLRPVRGGLPHRGHHRVQADGVLLHQPQRRHLHQGRSCWSTTTASPSTCRGRTGGRATTCTPRAGCGPPRRRERPPSRDRCSGRGSSGSGSGPRRAGQSVHRDDATTGSLPLRETLERHLHPRRPARGQARARGGPSAGCWRRPSGSPRAPARSTGSGPTPSTPPPCGPGTPSETHGADGGHRLSRTRPERWRLLGAVLAAAAAVRSRLVGGRRDLRGGRRHHPVRRGRAWWWPATRSTRP